MKFVKSQYVKLTPFEIQKYIKLIKDKFQTELAKNLNLLRVSAPIFVTPDSGFQDDLNGVERKVEFDIKKNGARLEIVQSLAKWKRYALKKYGFKTYHGLYTDMTAIRRDDDVDNLHSIYVDQWDWEKPILAKDRTIKYLKEIVRNIYKAFVSTNKFIIAHGYKKVKLPKDVYFITSQELLDLYPSLDAKQREYKIVKKYKAVFVMQVGGKLSNNLKHDNRAPDYDDWKLNGDLLFYHPVLDCCLELSSMGIRVNKDSMLAQLKEANKMERLQFAYHKMLLQDKIPLTIGGGIGQSRLCMLLLGRAHIGEVQSSYWDETNLKWCKKYNIKLL